MWAWEALTFFVIRGSGWETIQFWACIVFDEVLAVSRWWAYPLSTQSEGKCENRSRSTDCSPLLYFAEHIYILINKVDALTSQSFDLLETGIKCTCTRFTTEIVSCYDSVHMWSIVKSVCAEWEPRFSQPEYKQGVVGNSEEEKSTFLAGCRTTSFHLTLQSRMLVEAEVFPVFLMASRWVLLQNWEWEPSEACHGVRRHPG